MSDMPKKDVTAKEEATKKESKKTPAKKENDKGFFKRIGKFFREYRSEIKKISWPTFAEVVKNTIVTLIFVAFFAIVIGLLDWGVSSLRDWAILTARGETVVSTSDADAVVEDFMGEGGEEYRDQISGITTGTDA